MARMEGSIHIDEIRGRLAAAGRDADIKIPGDVGYLQVTALYVVNNGMLKGIFTERIIGDGKILHEKAEHFLADDAHAQCARSLFATHNHTN
jgi:hypothetical protein